MKLHPRDVLKTGFWSSTVGRRRETGGFLDILVIANADSLLK